MVASVCSSQAMAGSSDWISLKKVSLQNLRETENQPGMSGCCCYLQVRNASCHEGKSFTQSLSNWKVYIYIHMYKYVCTNTYVHIYIYTYCFCAIFVADSHIAYWNSLPNLINGSPSILPHFQNWDVWWIQKRRLEETKRHLNIRKMSRSWWEHIFKLLILMELLDENKQMFQINLKKLTDLRCKRLMISFDSFLRRQRPRLHRTVAHQREKPGKGFGRRPQRNGVNSNHDSIALHFWKTNPHL